MSGKTTIDPDKYWNPNIAKMIAQARDAGLIRLLTDEERDASRHKIIEAVAPGQPLWVFGYGSLMWNPDFPVAATRGALVRGWHRRFCLWTVLGRGTPERPGLMLGLETGGSCRGMALAIASERIEEATDRLWRREMMAGAYIPRWLEADTHEGPVKAVGFVINPEFERYAGRLDDEEVARHIAYADTPSRHWTRSATEAARCTTS